MHSIRYSLLLIAALAAGQAHAEGTVGPVPGALDPDGPQAAPPSGDSTRTQTNTTKLFGGDGAHKTAQQKAAADALKKLAADAQAALFKTKNTSKAPPTSSAGINAAPAGSQAPARQDTADGDGSLNGRAHEQQIAREILGDDKDAPVSQRVARLHAGGERALEAGVATVAMGITQLSLSEQDRAENGANDDNTQLRAIGTQNIAQGAQQAEAGRATIDHGNNVARHENKRASVGASSAMPIRPSTFDQSRASPETNEKLEEMERVAGVPAAALVQAVNSGSREELVSLAGGAKGVSEAAGAEIYAAIPNYGTSEARSPAGGSAPPPANAWSQPPVPVAPVPERKAQPAAERRVASTEPAARDAAGESLQSLGADNLLRSLGAKEIAAATPVREERSLFQRVSRQLSKRYTELR